MKTTLQNFSLLLVFGLVTLAHGGQDGFTSFDFPGAVNTQATAISPSGDIVGRYFSANGQQHGFLLTQGKFQTIDPLGSTYAEINWINPSGQMVGAYRLVDGKGHGFLLSAGQFITIDYPGSRGTIAGGISSSGDIVGAQFDDQFNLRAFCCGRASLVRSIFPEPNGRSPQ
jgi:uncharacterized membrane protein